MNKKIRLILSTFIGIFGVFLIGIAKQFDGYLINSIWWQTPNSWIIGILGIIVIVLAFKFALLVEEVE